MTEHKTVKFDSSDDETDCSDHEANGLAKFTDPAKLKIEQKRLLNSYLH